MGDEVKAEFVDMHLSARRLYDWHAETAEVFDNGHRVLESAATGWVGESAAALAAAQAKLRTSQIAVTSRLADHSAGISSAAHALQRQDSSTSDALLRIDVATPRRSLNLDT